MMTRPIAKIIVAGGRDFNDYQLLEYTINHMTSNLIKTHTITIVSGGARGADSLGITYVERNASEYIDLCIMNADWVKHGKSAGYIRNQQMADIATHCIVFWDGKSKGTKHMIDTATKLNIPIHTIYY